MEVITIKKYDETFDKIDCDPGTAMEISDYFTFEVPGAKFMPAYKSRMWDGKVRLFNVMACLLYCGLRTQLEKFCKTRNYKIEYDGIDGDDEFSLIEAEQFIKKLNPKLIPRDYQMDTFVHAVRKRRSLLLSPTASGKSFIIYLLTRYYSARTLIIVPTTSLVSQLASDFSDYGLDSDTLVHKIYSGQDKHVWKPITISTWQSIYKLPKEYFQQFKVVVGDEAHLFKAKSLIGIMTKLNTCKYKFGFTGTIDGTQTHTSVLEGLFGPIRKVTSTVQLMEQNHVAQLFIKALVLEYSPDIRKAMAGLDYQAEMDFLVRNDSRNNFLKNLALSLSGNSLILFQFVEKHGKILYDIITKAAVDRKIFFISGEIDGEKREEIRHIIETEKNAIVVASYGTSSTGINIRNLHNIVFASPFKSRIRNLQSIGRGLRKSDDGTMTTLFDVADDLTYKLKKNHTILHFIERIKIYNEEGFNYKIYNISIK